MGNERGMKRLKRGKVRARTTGGMKELQGKR